MGAALPPVATDFVRGIGRTNDPPGDRVTLWVCGRQLLAAIGPGAVGVGRRTGASRRCSRGWRDYKDRPPLFSPAEVEFRT